MDMVQVQLPATLVQQVKQTAAADKALEQVLVEAVQMWLDNQHQKQIEAEAEQALSFLRKTGLVMNAERQHSFAQSIAALLEIDEEPSRAEIEAALANLEPPLSEEIIMMRGKR